MRLVVDNTGALQDSSTYNPSGEAIESGVDPTAPATNPFMFTGQYFDSEIEEYYLRARSPWDIPPCGMQYNPHLGCFTSRDPVASDDSWPLPPARNLSCNSN